METIKKFEDLKVWQMSRKMCVEVYKLTGMPNFSKDLRFCSQIQAAAGSIMDNIAEGFEREGNKENIQFLYVAKGSCGEVRSQIYRAFDVEYISKEQFDYMMDSLQNISTMLYRYIQYLKNSKFQGNKYK